MKPLIIVLIVLLVLAGTSYQPAHTVTEKGLDCAVSIGAIDCNWEAWNLKTNFGMYPEKALE